MDNLQCKKVLFVWILSSFQLPSLVAAYQVVCIHSSILYRTSFLFIHNPFSGVLLWYCCSKFSFVYVGRKMFFVCWGFFSPHEISEVSFYCKDTFAKPKATSKICIILFPVLEKEDNIKMCSKPHVGVIMCYSSVSVRQFLFL